MLADPPVEEKANPNMETGAKEGEWRSIASFLLAFQSRRTREQAEERRVHIRHKESDSLSEDFEGMDVESDRPWRWMLDQLDQWVQSPSGLQEDPAVQAQPAEPPSPPELSIKPEIIEIRAFQPSQTEAAIEVNEAGDLFKGTLEENEPFALEASFAFTGSGASEVEGEQRACLARFSARPLPPGDLIPLADAEFCASVQDEPGCSVQIPKLSLPAGIYQLQVVVEVQGVGTTSRPVEGPIFQVA
jgi:hypothetical protein